MRSEMCIRDRVDGHHDEAIVQGPGPIERQMHLDLHTYMGDDILVKVDRASMATSLEVRVPFLDHRVVELAARMPLDLKIKGKRSKHILKQAMSSRLPKQVTSRGKKGFGMPVAQWLAQPVCRRPADQRTPERKARPPETPLDPPDVPFLGGRTLGTPRLEPAGHRPLR